MSHGQSSGVHRRVLLRGAALTGLGAPLLVACGSDEAPAPPEDEPSSAPLASTGDVPVGEGTVLKEEKVVLTQPTEGEFKAFTAVCTHQGCIVAQVKAGTIECGCHGSKYSAETGEVTGGPAPKPLAEIKITVDGDQINRA